MATYLHKTPHRLRVRSDFILHNPKHVAGLIHQLQKIDAIEHIRHKRFAGSVAIRFDPAQLEVEELLETVASHGWLQSEEQLPWLEHTVRNSSKNLVRGAALLALRQLLGPALSRALPR